MVKKVEITWDISSKDLKLQIKGEKDPKKVQRLLMILNVKKGKSATETAEILASSPNTIIKWVRKFNEFGFEGLYDEFRSGRPRIINHKQLKDALLKSPKEFGYDYHSWFPKLMYHYLKDFQGITLESNYVYDLFKKLGFSLKSPRGKSYKSDVKKVIKFKKNERTA